MCGPDHCGFPVYQQTWFNHRGGMEYYGMAARQTTGTDRWGHIFRVGGRGESIGATMNNDPTEGGDYSPHLAGHGIDFRDWNSATNLWTPDEQYNHDKLGASPAEENNHMDDTERAENIFQFFLSQTPGVGTAADAHSFVSNLYVEEGAGADTFGWQLDSMGGITYENSSTTDHFIEFEARAVPGDYVEGTVDTKTYLDYTIAGESPLGCTGFVSVETVDDPVPTSTQEAVDMGLDVKVRKEAIERPSLHETEFKASNVDVQDIIVPPGSGGSAFTLVTY